MLNLAWQILQQKYLGQSMEKNILSKKKGKPKYQESDQEDSESTPCKLGKKIKKNRRKKKGQIPKGWPQVNKQLVLFLEKNSNYFNHSIKEYTDSLKKKLRSTVDIREVLGPKKNFCYHEIKDNYKQQFELYLDLVNYARISATSEQIGLLPKNEIGLKIDCLGESVGQRQEGGQGFSVKRMLTEEEIVLLKLRQQAATQKENFFYQRMATLPYDQLELISLCKINTITEKEITHTFDRIALQKDSLQNAHQTRDTRQENSLVNQLMEACTIKNLEKSFSETPIDFLNYHKANQYYQENNYVQSSFDRISYLSQFKKYVFAKKPKSQRNDCYLLRTACTACFTQYSQPSNPIQNCPECHSRIHRYCQKIDKRCHRCRYGRTSKFQRSQTSYCYICNRQREKGLMIKTVNNFAPHRYAHVYCLMLHHFWKVENKEFIGEFIQPVMQDGKCLSCQSNEGYFMKCRQCKKQMHGMCAYLNGSSFKMERKGKDYKVEIKCCGDLEQKQRLSIQRKFKINYEKIIFRQDDALYKYIKQKLKMGEYDEKLND